MPTTIRIRTALRDPRAQITLILLLALALRLNHVLLNERWPAISGGDYSWYASEGTALLQTGRTLGPPQAGPIFLLVAGLAEQGDPAMVGSGQPGIRLLHALLGTLTVWLVYRIGRKLWDHKTGAITALVIAINPVFIIEVGNIVTESIAVFLLLWALAIWFERIESPDWRLMAAAGSLIALAALTRSILLAFPLLPLSHLLIRHGWRRAVRYGVMLLVVFLITLSPWTVYNLIQWQRLTLGGQGLMGMLYIGAVGWKAPEEVDAELGFEGAAPGEDDNSARQAAYSNGFLSQLTGDPAGYVKRRAGELLDALLQPHNTLFYPGESIKALVLNWIRQDRTPGGLIALTRADSFWPKLLLYVFHYTALLAGLAGLIYSLRRWRERWPLYAMVGYFLGIHTVIEVNPRYLFPLEPVWWLFGIPLLIVLVGWLQHRIARTTAGSTGDPATERTHNKAG